MNLLFVMDPVQAIDPGADTTCALMQAAEAAGHRLSVTELHQVEANPAPRALVRPIRVNPWCTLGDPERVPLDSMDAIFIRTDPPVDNRYVWAMQLLDLADRRCTLFLNDPAGILAANEKIYTLRFPQLTPPTLVSADPRVITDFLAEQRTAVIKPVDGHAGRGVLRLVRGDPNLPSILDLQTQHGAAPVVVQAALDATCGNRRIFMVDGEALAVVNRLPMPGDFRTGDVVEVLELSDQERRLGEEVGPALVRDGLRFAGLDVIDGRLIEVNVTSPGGLRQLERLSGHAYAPQVIARLLTPVRHPMEVTA
ncbi:MAG: glutathione synthase [Candidatus Dormibacteria bacterium]